MEKEISQLDLGVRLGRIEALLSDLKEEVVSHISDHERRIRHIERFAYGATAILSTIVIGMNFVNIRVFL